MLLGLLPAIGYVTARLIECTFILVGIVSSAARVTARRSTRPVPGEPWGRPACGPRSSRAERVHPARPRSTRARAGRAPFEAATTVRAHVRQNLVGAVAAERALVRADHRVGRVGRERAVAVLARGSEFEHVRFIALVSNRDRVADAARRHFPAAPTDRKSTAASTWTRRLSPRIPRGAATAAGRSITAPRCSS